MAESESDGLYEELKACIGMSLSTSGPAVAPDPVNMPMIHQWTDAFDDRNPVYEDAEFAKTTRFGDIVAPCAMLQTWTMARPIIEGIGERGGSPVEIDQESPLMTLDRAGFNGTVATNSELEFMRPLKVGESLQSDVVLESISERKTTGLGQGYFVGWVSNYVDDKGELVGKQHFRVFKFKPAGGEA